MWGPVSNAIIHETVGGQPTCTLCCDYRQGHMRDASLLQRHGTATAPVRLSRQGAHFAGVGRITHPDHALGRNTTGSVVVVMTEPSGMVGTFARILSVRDAGGARFEIGVNNSSIAFHNPYQLMPNVLNGTLGIDYTDGVKPSIYVNGVFGAVGSLNATVPSYNAAFTVGNYYSGALPCNRAIACVLETNRPLTATEHAAVHAEMNAKGHCTKAFDRVTLSDGRKVWASSSGVPVSTASRGGVTGQELENTGWRFGSTAFRGTVQAGHVIDGREHRAIVCSTAGPLYLPTSLFGQTAAEAAYGAFEAILYHADASVTDWHFITNSAGITGQRYVLRVTAAEVLELHKDGAAIASSATPIVAGTHTRYRITRSAIGAFVVSVNPAGGNWYTAITVTDNDYTVSTNQVFDPDAGDMISLGSGSGDGLVKVTL